MDLGGEGEREGGWGGGGGGHGLGVAKDMCLLERVDIGSPLRRQVFFFCGHKEGVFFIVDMGSPLRRQVRVGECVCVCVCVCI